MNADALARPVKWGRSDEGYVDSLCGEYQIVPCCCGTTRPQFYDLYFRALGGPVKIGGMFETQRDAKAEADEHRAARDTDDDER